MQEIFTNKEGFGHIQESIFEFLPIDSFITLIEFALTNNNVVILNFLKLNKYIDQYVLNLEYDNEDIRFQWGSKKIEMKKGTSSWLFHHLAICDISFYKVLIEKNIEVVLEKASGKWSFCEFLSDRYNNSVILFAKCIKESRELVLPLLKNKNFFEDVIDCREIPMNGDYQDLLTELFPKILEEYEDIDKFIEDCEFLIKYKKENNARHKFKSWYCVIDAIPKWYEKHKNKSIIKLIKYIQNKETDLKYLIPKICYYDYVEFLDEYLKGKNGDINKILEQFLDNKELKGFYYLIERHIPGVQRIFNRALFLKNFEVMDYLFKTFEEIEMDELMIENAIMGLDKELCLKLSKYKWTNIDSDFLLKCIGLLLNEIEGEDALDMLYFICSLEMFDKHLPFKIVKK